MPGASHAPVAVSDPSFPSRFIMISSPFPFGGSGAQRAGHWSEEVFVVSNLLVPFNWTVTFPVALRAESGHSLSPLSEIVTFSKMIVTSSLVSTLITAVPSLCSIAAVGIPL